MIRWNNDYNKAALPGLLKAIAETSDTAYPGYGTDEWCDKAAEMIRELSECPEAAIHFFPGATQANYIVAAAALRPIESVICAFSGHIYAHEAGSVENTAHKLLPLEAKDGKITAEQIEAEAAKYYDNGQAEYLTRPGMVYISFATEWGTIYSLAELEKISAVCKKYDMYLFVDGARLSYGMGAHTNDIALSDFARLCDVFYLGGTKCGALFGEALVITNKRLQTCFKTYMKQNGAVLAKGWLMGLQFCELLKNGEYFEIGRRADAYAMEIRAAFLVKGIEMYADNPTNQQFPLLTDEQVAKLNENHICEELGMIGDKRCVRYCTSWATSREDVDQLVRDILNL